MRYDAFISYRHGGLDGYVAEKLHKMLESYRIPKAIAKRIGKKKLARVFRDREELPTSSNLSDSINEALENSEFLLLICSRRTCESLWVMREVERFSELHGKDRIITLLIEGEPDESFPPGLQEREVGGVTVYVEPLAADIRAETPKESIKLLKEEKLRLLSPILGCAFDDLRRRHRRRRIQRAAVIIAAAFAFVLSFGMFSTYQYMQIDRQMQLKLENQSFVLAEYSATQLAAGDRDMAILLALAALPENLERQGRPLVAAAEMALSNALGVYDIAEGFKPHRTITLPAAPGMLRLSPNESYAAAIYPYELAIIDTASGAVLAVLPTVRSALAGAVFMSDDIIVFTGEDGVEAYHITRGGSLWRGEKGTFLDVSANGYVVAAVYKDSGEAVIYSGDGHVISRLDFTGRSMRIPVDDSFINPHDTLFALSADGGKLAVSFADGSMSLFDTVTGDETLLHHPGGAIHFAGGFYGGTLLYSVVERNPYYSALVVYDAAVGMEITRYESDTMNFLPHAGREGLFAAFENHIMAVDAETGEVFQAASAGARVQSFAYANGGFLISERDGVYRFTDNSRVYESDYICHFLGLGSRFALTGSRDSSVVRILRRSSASGAVVMQYDRSYRFSEAKLGAEHAVFYSYNGMRVYDLSGNIVAETLFPDPLSVRNTEYDRHSGNIAVIYDSVLRLYSGIDTSLILEAHGKSGVKSVIYTPFGVSVTDEDRVTLYDLGTGDVIMSRQRPEGADQALLLGSELIHSTGDAVFHGEHEISAGAGQSLSADRAADIIGADRIGYNSYAIAVSDGGSVRVMVMENGFLRSSFSTDVRGRAEVYFVGGYVFISPMHGDASAFTLDGRFIRSFPETGYLAEIYEVSGFIAAGYVSSASERYSLLLRPGVLETVALLPGFLDETATGLMVLDSGASLVAASLLTTQELMDMAAYVLDGRVLSTEEIEMFKAG